ncbi:hypothetical protein PMAYCL1PPCAC_20405, partial [Pristionchus mayeri]
KRQRGTVGSRRLAWVNREKIWKKKNVIRDFARIVRLKEKNEELIEFLDMEGLFPILDLPDELISNIFSILPMKDRLRARVNRRLNAIEARSKYVEKSLEIVEAATNSDDDPVFKGVTRIVVSEDKTYSECIRKIARNTYFESLTIDLSGPSEFHSMIKEFNIGYLLLMFNDEEMEDEIVVDSFFVEAIKTCKHLDMFSMDNITAEALHELFKKKMSGEIKLGKLECEMAKLETCISFLRLIGITFRAGKFYSNRDIEVYEKWDEEKLDGVFIFDGAANMYFGHCQDEMFDDDFGCFSVSFSNRREWPNNNQGEYEKIEVYPE